jgi:hypothetical protein
MERDNDISDETLKEKIMRLIHFFLMLIVALAFMSCSSPQDKAYKAQENVHNERLVLVEKYQQCLKEAGDDSVKTEACDQYLKAAEALK